MSDDFLEDLNSEVEDRASGKPAEPVTNNVTQEPAHQEIDPEESNKIAHEVLDLTASDEERAAAKKERETLTVKRDEKTDDTTNNKEKEQQKQQETADDKGKQEEGKTQTTQEQDKDDKRLYMDRYLGEDENGNFVDPHGNVIATSGVSRKYYENLKKEARQQRDAAEQAQLNIFELGKRFKDLHADYEALKDSPETKSIAERTGMSSGEVDRAINTMKLLKDDPIAGLKKVLTEAAASGIDISSLGVGNGAIDISAIKDMVADAVKERDAPVTTNVKTPEQLQEEAVSEVKEFIQTHKDVTEEEIKAITKAKGHPDPNISGRSLGELLIAYRSVSRKKAEQRDEEAFTSNVKKTKEKQQRSEPPKRQEQRRNVSPRKDYATMDYREIAQDILNGD